MATKIEILENKNGVELWEIVSVSTGKPICWELYMDGEWINRYHNKREARSMWKDFSGC